MVFKEHGAIEQDTDNFVAVHYFERSVMKLEPRFTFVVEDNMRTFCLRGALMNILV